MSFVQIKSLKQFLFDGQLYLLRRMRFSGLFLTVVVVVDVDHCRLQKLIILPTEYTCEFRVVITRADNGIWVGHVGHWSVLVTH